MQLLLTGVVRRVPPSAPLQLPVFYVFQHISSLLRALLVALLGAVAETRPELASSGCVARAETFVYPITVAVGHAAEEVWQYVPFSAGLDGADVCLHESSA